MKKILFILIAFFFLGCDDTLLHDEPFLVLSTQTSIKSEYKFKYRIRYLYIDNSNERLYKTAYIYSNDTLRVGTTLYLKVGK